MKIVILGCGRVGARLAKLMEAEGNHVSIIDSDPAAFRRLPEDFTGDTVLGTGIDVDVLKSAGIENADAFAAVTNFDNTNIMACQVAKEIFGVPKVLARIYDPGREDLYHELGLETICPTTLISTTAKQILLAAEGVEVIQMPPHTDKYDGGVVVTSSEGPEAEPAQTQEANKVPVPQQAQQQSPAPIPAQYNTTQMDPLRQQGTSSIDRPEHNGRGLRAFFRH